MDIVENRFVGMKSRGCYETPGGTLLYHGHKAVESLTLDRQVMSLRDELVPKYASMVYNGFWYAPERVALQGLMDGVQANVTGTARLQLYKGSVTVLGRKSPRSLYRQDVVTFEEDAVYNQADAEGFIKLNALRLRTAAGAEDRGAKSQAQKQTQRQAKSPHDRRDERRGLRGGARAERGVAGRVRRSPRFIIGPGPRRGKRPGRCRTGSSGAALWYSRVRGARSFAPCAGARRGAAGAWTASPPSPEERAQGFGRWLMTKLEALAIQRNVPTLHLHLGEAQRDLLPYYRRMGYRVESKTVEGEAEGDGVLSKRVGGTWQYQG